VINSVKSGRRALPTVAAVAAVVICAVVAIGIGAGRAGAPPIAKTLTGTGASLLFAGDGKTLIARFDQDPPARSCERPSAAGWGFYCAYVVDWWLAQPVFGASAKERLERLRTGGYRLVGSLDVPAQTAAKQRVDRLTPATDPTVLSLVTVEPGTGLVRTMSANRNYRRVPGPSPTVLDESSTGPPPRGPDTTDLLPVGDVETQGTPAGATFMVFTMVAALEHGLPLGYSLDTGPVYQTHYRVPPPDGCGTQRDLWCVENTGDPRYRSGKRTMWDAFNHALPTYFVKLQEQVGVDAVVEVARRLGIRFRGADEYLATHGTHWGAVSLGVSSTTALDLANAYATLAADGVRCDPRPARQVVDADGKALRIADPHCERVISAEIARAALDAARCPLGGASAVGAVCGAASGPAATVSATVGRPVAGQLAVPADHAYAALVLTSPQLSTATVVGVPDRPYRSDVVPEASVPGVVELVTQTHLAGLTPLASRDFAPPPESLTGT
jgi:membrane peptidoglycan carboxypeptidase